MFGVLSVVSAKVSGSAAGSFLKPDLYCELTVDGKQTKKTAVLKRTDKPQWKEAFTVYVCSVDCKLQIFHHNRNCMFREFRVT